MEESKALQALSFLAFLAGIYGLYQLRLLWIIVRTKTSPIGELTSGFREVKGVVARDGKLLRSPLTDTPCVYYHLLISTYNGRRSVKLVDEEKKGTFIIRDETGQVAVNPKDSKLILNVNQHSFSDILSEPDENMLRVLRRYKLKSKTLRLNNSYTYLETVLEPGAQLYVLGPVEVGKRRLFKKKPAVPLIIAERSEARLIFESGALTLVSFGIVAFVILLRMGII